MGSECWTSLGKLDPTYTSVYKVMDPTLATLHTHIYIHRSAPARNCDYLLLATWPHMCLLPVGDRASLYLRCARARPRAKTEKRLPTPLWPRPCKSY
ncbi:hypothetical protein PoB_003627400 [Plakobranchus ocellatus]|uniref:Uncharacterized protein n=1 Tax=Plakobranchus ocellatus TaxID=259542 RepID=A0AAV4APN8_9GAST|nr:hypothetical protein PoB_003627400 [Plakobranchus ocellatus]